MLHIIECRTILYIRFYAFVFPGCFDLLLDAEKCKYGIEIQSTLGPGPFGSTGMFFGASATPSTLSPGRTPWAQQTPSHPEASPMGPCKLKKAAHFCPAINNVFDEGNL